MHENVDIQTHLIHQGTYCSVLRCGKLSNSDNSLLILEMTMEVYFGP